MPGDRAHVLVTLSMLWLGALVVLSRDWTAPFTNSVKAQTGHTAASSSSSSHTGAA